MSTHLGKNTKICPACDGAYWGMVIQLIINICLSFRKEDHRNLLLR